MRQQIEDLALAAGRVSVLPPYCRRPLIIVAAIAVGCFGLSAGARDAGKAFDQRCEFLDDAAAQAVADLVAERSEAAEARLSDAVFRLRRARKNCRIGLLSLARSDYEALLRGSSGPH